MKKYIATIGLLGLISGCASLDLKRSADANATASTQKIGTVSVLGDTFTGTSIGTTILTNTEFLGNVPEWGVDNFISQYAYESIKQTGKFPVALLEKNGLSNVDLRKNENRKLFELAAAQGMDTLVVAYPTVSSNYPHFKPGFGLHEHNFFGLSKRCVYAGFAIAVLKVGANKTSGWEWGGPMPCDPHADKDIPYKKSFNDYTEAEKVDMKGRLERRIKYAVDYAIGRLKL